jgi:hypothetical protein
VTELVWNGYRGDAITKIREFLITKAERAPLVDGTDATSRH